MLAPIITEHFENGNIIEDSELCNEQNQVVSIQKLTQFIDMFNYYPIKVHKVRYKNDSDGLTYVMNSGVHGTKNELGEYAKFDKAAKTEDEKYLNTLLQLVSDKIRERFVDIKRCFRFLDADHSQSITINEFA